MNRSFGLLMMLVSSTLQAASIQHLRCEHLVDPIGIDTLRPRLSWQIDSDRRDEMQSAYQVIVSSDDGETVWDSGKVTSDAMQVVCDLKEPASSQRFAWKVRVWDRDNKPSEFGQPA